MVFSSNSEKFPVKIIFWFQLWFHFRSDRSLLYHSVIQPTYRSARWYRKAWSIFEPPTHFRQTHFRTHASGGTWLPRRSCISKLTIIVDYVPGTSNVLGWPRHDQVTHHVMLFHPGSRDKIFITKQLQENATQFSTCRQFVQPWNLLWKTEDPSSFLITWLLIMWL